MVFKTERYLFESTIKRGIEIESKLTYALTMPQAFKSKSSAPRSQMSGSPVPVVRDEFVPRSDGDEYNPNASVGSEEPTAPTYDVEDEQQENMNERIDQNTKISHSTLFMLGVSSCPELFFKLRWTTLKTLSEVAPPLTNVSAVRTNL